MVDHQHDDGPDHGDDEAVEVEAGDRRGTDQREQEAADDRADYAKNNVEQEALARFVDDLAADESGDETEQNPSNKRHHRLRSIR